MNLSSSALLQLPHELLLRICEYSSPSSLKQLRSSCTNLKALADPILWHTIYLYPHMDRFRQILDLSLHEPVRYHVQQVVYDLRWAPLAELIAQRLGHVYSARVPEEEKNHVFSKIDKAKRGTLEPGRDDDIELLFLQDVLRNLRSLQSIKVYENNASATETDSIDLQYLPSYYQKLREQTCGLFPDTDLDPGRYCLRGATRSTKRVLVAGSSLGSKIRNFEVYNAHWEHVVAFERDGKHLHLLQDFISGLRSLQLHAKFERHLTPNFLMRNLGIVLNLATSLESLDLSFSITRECDPFSDTEDWDSDDGDDPISASHSVLEIMDSGADDDMCRWGTGLKRLVLSELRCSPSDLLNVLKRCAPTLKELELNHLELFPERAVQSYTALHPGSEESQPKPCLIALFKKIRSLLNIDNIHLSRHFRNSGGQAFYFNHEPAPGVHTQPALVDLLHTNTSNEFGETTRRDGRPAMANQVTHWLLGAETCPIEVLAVKEGKLDVTDDQLEAGLPLIDHTFSYTRDWLRNEFGDLSDASEPDLTQQHELSGTHSPISPQSPIYPHSPWSPMPPLEDLNGAMEEFSGYGNVE